MFFEIEEAFNAFGLVYDKLMISTPSRKTRVVVIQSHLVRTFAIGTTKHKIIRTLQQCAETE